MGNVKIKKGDRVLTVSRKAFDIIYRAKGFSIVPGETVPADVADDAGEVVETADTADTANEDAPPAAPPARKARARRGAKKEAK